MLLFVAAPCWALLDARGDGKAVLVQSRGEAQDAVVNAVGGVVSLIQFLRANLAQSRTELPTYKVVLYPEKLLIEWEHDMLCVVDTGHVGSVCEVMLGVCVFCCSCQLFMSLSKCGPWPCWFMPIWPKLTVGARSFTNCSFAWVQC